MSLISDPCIRISLTSSLEFSTGKQYVYLLVVMLCFFFFLYDLKDHQPGTYIPLLSCLLHWWKMQGMSCHRLLTLIAILTFCRISSWAAVAAITVCLSSATKQILDCFLKWKKQPYLCNHTLCVYLFILSTHLPHITFGLACWFQLN